MIKGYTSIELIIGIIALVVVLGLVGFGYLVIHSLCHFM